MSDTMHSAAEHLWEMANADAGRAYMDAQNARADTIRATFAAGVNAAAKRDARIKTVVAIAGEVERHANAIDPSEVTAVSVLVDLVIDLAGGMRHLANIMDTDAHPAPIIIDEADEPVSLMDDEVAA